MPARSAPASTQPSAAHEVAVARYRQTVLTAFQGVEDQLTNARSQAEQADFLKQASDAADQTEQQILNRYRAGQLGYTDVVTAQASALAARRALVQVGGQPAGERDQPDPGARRRLGRRRAGRAEELAAQRQRPLSALRAHAPRRDVDASLSKHLSRDAALLRQNLRSIENDNERDAMEKIWLKQYPAGVPAEIDVNQYPSLVALLDESFRRYADRTAYKFMGKAISFRQVDQASAAFAALAAGAGPRARATGSR